MGFCDYALTAFFHNELIVCTDPISMQTHKLPRENFALAIGMIRACHAGLVWDAEIGGSLDIEGVVERLGGRYHRRYSWRGLSRVHYGLDDCLMEVTPLGVKDEPTIVVNLPAACERGIVHDLNLYPLTSADAERIFYGGELMPHRESFEPIDYGIIFNEDGKEDEE